MDEYFGFSKHQYKILSAYMDAAVKILPKYYKPDCCIATARIAKEVLEEFHFKVQPLTVQVNITNSVLVKSFEKGIQETPEELLEKGGWQIILGSRGELQPKKWPGHLVAIVQDKVMIDISLVQANRPHKNINLHPLLIEIIDNKFLTGEKERYLIINECHLAYKSFPEDKTFMAAVDWYNVQKHKESISLIMKNMKNILKK
jgi:hypothetical protein